MKKDRRKERRRRERRRRERQTNCKAGKPLQLLPGTKSPKRNQEEAIEELKRTVEEYMHPHIEAVKAAKEQDALILIHQDSFAAGYHVDEYTLLGVAIKYAGLHGVGVQIYGTNEETLK